MYESKSDAETAFDYLADKTLHGAALTIQKRTEKTLKPIVPGPPTGLNQAAAAAAAAVPPGPFMGGVNVPPQIFYDANLMQNVNVPSFSSSSSTFSL